MEFHIHHHTVPDRQLQQRLDLLLSLLDGLTANLEQVMATLDEVLDAVKAESGQIDSIAMLVAQLHEQVRGATSGILPADVQEKVDKIFQAAQANKAKLADAINANSDSPSKEPDSFSRATGQPAAAPDPTAPAA